MTPAFTSLFCNPDCRGAASLKCSSRSRAALQNKSPDKSPIGPTSPDPNPNRNGRPDQWAICRTYGGLDQCHAPDLASSTNNGGFVLLVSILSSAQILPILGTLHTFAFSLMHLQSSPSSTFMFGEIARIFVYCQGIAPAPPLSRYWTNAFPDMIPRRATRRCSGRTPR